MKCYSERVAHGGRCVCVGGGMCAGGVGWGGVSSISIGTTETTNKTNTAG